MADIIKFIDYPHCRYKEMNRDSGYDNKDFETTPYLKLIEDWGGATCLCYQMRLRGKLHFLKKDKTGI